MNILERFPVREQRWGSVANLHLLAETLKIVWSDRRPGRRWADWRTPAKGLASKDYAAERAKLIRGDGSLDARTLPDGNPIRYESKDTTHFSVVDAAGNAVSEHLHPLRFLWRARRGAGHRHPAQQLAGQPCLGPSRRGVEGDPAGPRQARGLDDHADDRVRGRQALARHRHARRRLHHRDHGADALQRHRSPPERRRGRRERRGSTSRAATACSSWKRVSSPDIIPLLEAKRAARCARRTPWARSSRSWSRATGPGIGGHAPARPPRPSAPSRT